MHKKLGCDSSVYVCLVPGEINNLRIFIFIRMLRCYIFRFKGNKQFSNLHFDGRGAAKHPWSCPLFVLPTQSFLSFETGEDVVTLYQQERDILTHQKALWDTPFSCSSLTPEKHHEFVSSSYIFQKMLVMPAMWLLCSTWDVITPTLNAAVWTWTYLSGVIRPSPNLRRLHQKQHSVKI